MKYQRIYLLGFMGSGKSYVGKKLAALLEWEFLDLDEAIVKDAGMSIPEIFSRLGEGAFREMENNALHQTKQTEKMVIATGGGAPCFFDNIEWINSNGVSVFLSVDPQLLAERLLPERDSRPLIAGKSAPELKHFIEQKLSERAQFYARAHVTFHQSENGDNIAERLQKMIEKL